MEIDGKKYRKAIRQPFELAFAASGETINKKFELDSDIALVTGIKVTATNNTLMSSRAKINEIRFNRREVLREQYAERFYSSSNVAAKDRMFPLKEVTSEHGIFITDTEVNIKVTDSGLAGFSSYTMRVYLEAWTEE